MIRCRASVSLLLTLSAALAAVTSFRVFPEEKQLVSPDGRFVITSEDPIRSSADFSGILHSLYLEERATGRKRKLYDYVRRVAVAWATPEAIIVTDYVAPKSARALVFSIEQPRPIAVLDRELLSRMIPEEQSDHLTKNDHVYLEVMRLEDSTLVLRVWGYGALDKNGFKLGCRYDWNNNTAVCHIPH
jgi:hypothetical protein